MKEKKIIGKLLIQKPKQAQMERDRKNEREKNDNQQSRLKRGNKYMTVLLVPQLFSLLSIFFFWVDGRTAYRGAWRASNFKHAHRQ